MTPASALLVAGPSAAATAGGGAPSVGTPAGTFDPTRDYFPRGRVVATRPPVGAPTMLDAVRDYMAEEWGEWL